MAEASKVKETAVGLVAIVALAAVGLTMCGESDQEAAARVQAEAQAQAAKEAACRADLQCLGDKLHVAATVRCVDPVERLAKHSAKWVDEMLEPKFSHFRWGAGKQSVTMIGDRVQFQNGFGAYTNMVYECSLSLDGERVLDVKVREGRL